MDNSANLLIFGAGGYGQVVKELAERMDKFNRIEFLDDNNNPLAIGKIADAETYFKDYTYAVIAIGNCDVREKLFKEAEKIGFELVNIISDKSFISSSAQIGKGCVIEPNVSVSANSIIGDGVFLCAGSSAGHNCVINDFCQVDYNGVVAVGATVPSKTKIIAGSVYSKQA